MPGTWIMLVAVASFPAALSPGDRAAAERPGLPAGGCGGHAVCHLRGPLRCRLAVCGLECMARSP